MCNEDISVPETSNIEFEKKWLALKIAHSK